MVRRLPLGGTEKYPTGISFSADGKSLIVPQYKGFIQTWDVATGKETRAEQLDNSGRQDKDFLQYQTFLVSPDGKSISTLEHDYIDSKPATILPVGPEDRQARTSRR